MIQGMYINPIDKSELSPLGELGMTKLPVQNILPFINHPPIFTGHKKFLALVVIVWKLEAPTPEVPEYDVN